MDAAKNSHLHQDRTRCSLKQRMGLWSTEQCNPELQKSTVRADIAKRIKVIRKAKVSVVVLQMGDKG